MKRRIQHLTLAFLSILAPGLAAAAPGDYVTIYGRVLDPRGRFVAVAGDDGRTYHVDVADLLDRTAFRDLKTGDLIALTGVEGTYPNEVRAQSVGRDTAREPASTADTFVYWDWRLPRNHTYETYQNGRYTPVDITSVPARIDAGEWIYDRTARVWVSHPSVGRNSAYLASSTGPPAIEVDTVRLDGWRLSRSHRYERYVSDGSYSAVDVMSVPSRIAQGDWIYDRTADVWLSHPSVGGRNPAYFSGERLSGRVQGVRGSQLTLRTEDGRMVTVDLTDLSHSSRQGLRWGDAVTLSGSIDASGIFRAWSVEPGSPSALPRQ